MVSPDEKEGGVWINQNARFALADLDAGREISFETAFKDNGVYVFVISGEITIGDQKLGSRDALGVFDIEKFYDSGKSKFERARHRNPDASVTEKKET